MEKKDRRQKGENPLSRERIVREAIALLDARGEGGLTFRALSERLATGAGAIYWHIADKSDLLTAACDAVMADALATAAAAGPPEQTVRAVAAALFDTLDVHPWAGTALARAPGQLPAVRILEALGQPLMKLGVADTARWSTASALLGYVLGVGAQNAANAELAQRQGLDRTRVLNEVAETWAALDAQAYPFTRSVAARFADHDDREDFLAGVDLLLDGIRARVRR